MQVNTDVLSARIKALLKVPTDDTHAAPKRDDHRDPMFVYVLPLINGEIVRNALKSKAPVDDCDGLFKKLRTAKILGSGYSGTVFDIGAKRVVKVERVYMKPDGTVEAANVGEVARKMGALGVGPKVYSWQLCDCATSSIFSVLEMEKITGMSLRQWLGGNRTDAQKAKVRKALSAKVDKMNKAGVIHSDLHDENILVDKQGVPWIIDFTFLQKKHDDNKDVLIHFDQRSRRDMEKPLAVFKALVEEGTIQLTGKRCTPLKVGGFGWSRR